MLGKFVWIVKIVGFCWLFVFATWSFSEKFCGERINCYLCNVLPETGNKLPKELYGKTNNHGCPNGGMVDTRDLKSLGHNRLCGFESRIGHKKPL